MAAFWKGSHRQSRLPTHLDLGELGHWWPGSGRCHSLCCSSSGCRMAAAAAASASSSSSLSSSSSCSSPAASSPSARSHRLRWGEEPGVRGAGLGLRDGELAPRRRQWPRRNRPPPPGSSRRARRARPARPRARPAGGGGGAGQVDAAGRWRPRARAVSGGGAGGCYTGSRWCSSVFCSAGPTTPTPYSCA